MRWWTGSIPARQRDLYDQPPFQRCRSMKAGVPECMAATSRSILRLHDSIQGRLLLVILGAIAYTCAYQLLWRHSLDQWFLPAGLRASLLLWLPLRAWPYMFLCDAVAMLYLRVPMAPKHGNTWAYLSPFMLAPLLALVVYPIRRVLGGRLRNAHYLPPVMLILAVWMTIVLFCVNAALSGPPTMRTELIPDGLRLTLGNYLGMLTIVPFGLMVASREPPPMGRVNFWRDAVIAVVATTLLFWLALPDSPDHAISKLTLSMVILFLAALVMTIRHDWRGASMGILATAIATKVSGHWGNITGFIDQTLYPTDQAIAVVGSILIVLGGVINRHYVLLRGMGLSEQRAKELARTSFGLAERSLRDRLMFMAQMQLHLDDHRRSLMARLRQHGHHAAAMDLNVLGVDQQHWFDRNATALYPIQIERDGLYAALHARSFSDFWAHDSEIMCLLRGNPRKLSLPLQLAAYRCICSALSLLGGGSASRYVIRVRSWSLGGTQGAAIIVHVTGERQDISPELGALAEVELEMRAHAFGGRAQRRRQDRVAVLLAEHTNDGDEKHSDSLAHSINS